MNNVEELELETIGSGWGNMETLTKEELPKDWYWYWLDKPPLDWKYQIRNLPKVEDPTGTDLVGWVNNVNFTPVDYRTLSWDDWSIILADWTTYVIWEGDTGTMSATTYLYLDIETSTILTTTTPQNSVWEGKILVWVAKPTVSWKDVEYQIFWTNNQSVFITADNIAANTITGNEIAANTITASQINTWSISIWEWWWSIDNVDDWTTYKRTTTNEKTGAGRWFNALSSNNRYVQWLNASEMSDGTNPTTWVLMDSAWIRWYKSGEKTFEIATTWDAFFKWDIWASTITAGSEITSWWTITWWTIRTSDWDDRVVLSDDIIPWEEVLRRYKWGTWVGYFRSATTTFQWNDVNAVLLREGSSTNYVRQVINGSLIANRGVYVEDDGRFKLPVGTDLYNLL